MTGTCFATFRSRGPQPPAAEARNTNRGSDWCVPRRLRPSANNGSVKHKFPRQRTGRTPPHGRPATLVNSERSPGRPTRIKNNRTVNFAKGCRDGTGIANERAAAWRGCGPTLCGNLVLTLRLLAQIPRLLRVVVAGYCKPGVGMPPPGLGGRPGIG